MATQKLMRFDTDGFLIEHDGANDDLSFNSLTLTGGTLAMGSAKITGMADGTAATDGATKGQLDSIAAGFDPKESCRLKTAASLSTWASAGSGVGATLISPTTATANNDFDSVTAALNDRILVTFAGATEVADDDNGIYTVTQLADGTSASTILTRATDHDEDTEVTAGNYTFVTGGNTTASTGWYIVTADAITVDTTPILWSQFAGVGTFTGGAGIDITSGVVSVDLGIDPGLEFTGGGSDLLEVLVNPAGAIEKVTAGIGTIVESTNPTLDIASNELGVKFSTTAGGLDQDATGLKVKVDGTTMTINGSGQLVASSEVDEAGRLENDYTTDGGGVTIGDPLHFNGNGIVGDSDAATGVGTGDLTFAVAAETIGASLAVRVISEGPANGTISGATAGNPFYLASGGGLTSTKPTGAVDVVLMGYAINATDLYVHIQHLGRGR